jgi:hypothetical protein
MADMVASFAGGELTESIKLPRSRLPECIIVEAGDFNLETWMSQQQG